MKKVLCILWMTLLFGCASEDQQPDSDSNTTTAHPNTPTSTSPLHTVETADSNVDSSSQSAFANRAPIRTVTCKRTRERTKSEIMERGATELEADYIIANRDSVEKIYAYVTSTLKYQLYKPGRDPSHVCELDVNQQKAAWRAQNDLNYCGKKLNEILQTRQSEGFTCQ